VNPQLALDLEGFDPPLTCAFGTPWQWCMREPCAACRAESDRMLALFRARVACGELDEDGYTPAERLAKERRS
jgi:hypothetical protein